MTERGLQRKIDFRVACILTGISLKEFGRGLCPPVSGGAVSLFLNEQARSRRIGVAVRDFIVECKTATGMRVSYCLDDLEAVSKIRSYRLKIDRSRFPSQQKRRK